MENKQNILNDYAKEFAEGSETLEQILLNLWGMGIKTFACCKGFKNKDHERDFIRPYIAIIITPESIEKVQTLMKYLELQKRSNRPNMAIIKDGPIINGRTALCIERFCMTNSRCQKVLDAILDATESMKKQAPLPPKSNVDITFQLMQDFVDRDLVFYDIRQAIINCSHLKSTPTFEIKSSRNLRISLTEASGDRALNEWRSCSMRVKSSNRDWFNLGKGLVDLDHIEEKGE